MTDFPDDPLENRAIKIAEDRRRKRRQRELDDVQTILSVVQGRRFVWRILIETGIFGSCFDTNALSMAQKEGKRDIGLMILSEIKKASFSSLGQMEKEAESDAAAEAEQRKKSETEKEE